MSPFNRYLHNGTSSVPHECFIEYLPFRIPAPNYIIIHSHVASYSQSIAIYFARRKRVFEQYLKPACYSRVKLDATQDV